jgi:hypothetical protein
MNIFLRGAVCAPLLALVAGCCANNANNCDDIYADSLYLTLANNRTNADTVTTSFTRSELDTVYLQRYTPAKAAVPANGAIPSVPATPAAYSDPQTIVQTQQTTINSALKARLKAAGFAPSNTLVISNNAPFPTSTTGGKLSAYSYILKIHDRAVKNAPTYIDTLKQIQLQGRYNADGCTTCYENTQKTVVRKGINTTQTFDVTETTVQNGIKVPVPLPITKLD